MIDAEVNVRDGKVVMRKRCPAHGRFEALVYSDADVYLAQMRFNKPGTLPLEFQTEVPTAARSTAACAPITSSTRAWR